MIGVSFVMPVYNGLPYVRQALESMLAQTYPNTEIVIINDGSTDGTKEWLDSLTNTCIKVIHQYPNRGLIASLNMGVQVATNPIIARMDADDICTPHRLQIQVNALLANPSWSAVAGCIEFINEDGKATGNWPLDRATISPEKIRRNMAWECCIAHPTVVLYKNLLLEFPYNNQQKNIEDYDLWLRLLAANKIIGKVSETVLQYRVHTSSITKKNLHANNFYFKKLRCKMRFVLARNWPFCLNSFVWKVALMACADAVFGTGKLLKKAL